MNKTHSNEEYDSRGAPYLLPPMLLLGREVEQLEAFRVVVQQRSKLRTTRVFVQNGGTGSRATHQEGITPPLWSKWCARHFVSVGAQFVACFVNLTSGTNTPLLVEFSRIDVSILRTNAAHRVLLLFAFRGPSICMRH